MSNSNNQPADDPKCEEASNVACDDVMYAEFVDVRSESQWGANNVNLHLWLSALKKRRDEAEKINSSELVLGCLSYREPYLQINREVTSPQEKSDEQTYPLDTLQKRCERHFSINSTFIAMQFITWHPKISFPIFSENVFLRQGPGWGMSIFAQPGYEEHAKKVREAMCVENSKEFLFFYANEEESRKDVLHQYEVLCNNIINSLLPFPEVCSKLLFTDVIKYQPSGSSAVATWTFVLFNLAWKQHEYSALQAKRANPSCNGQYAFINDAWYAMELVRSCNEVYYKGGRQPFPMLSPPFLVTNIVSFLENLFAASVEALDLLFREVESIINTETLPKNHDVSIEEKHLKNEKCFREEIVGPLLRSMGYKNVRHTHGPNEFGKDFIAVDSDKTHEYHVAFVIKAGNVSGKSDSTVDDIISQIEMAFNVQYTSPDTMQQVSMSKVVVIVSGKYLDNAKIRLSSKYGDQCKRGILQFWDSAKVEALIKEHGMPATVENS